MGTIQYIDNGKGNRGGIFRTCTPGFEHTVSASLDRTTGNNHSLRLDNVGARQRGAGHPFVMPCWEAVPSDFADR